MKAYLIKEILNMELIDHVKLLKIKNKEYAFDTHHLLLCEISDVYKSCIESILQKREVQDLYGRFDKSEVDTAFSEINEYIDAGILFSKEYLEYPYSNADAIGCFSFPPEHRCNLSCKYCFADHGDNYKEDIKVFPGKTIEKSFDYVINQLYPNLKRYRIDFVSGGEPLLNFDIIKKTCQVRDEYQQKKGKPIDIFLATNATLLSEGHLQYFSKNNINLGVSLDGDRQENDNCRIYYDGRGTYDSVIKSIQLILDNKTISRNVKNIWSLCVLHSENTNLLKILEHHNTIGIKTVQMKVVRLTKDHPLSINSNNVNTLLDGYTELNNAIINELRQGEKRLINMVLNDNDYYGKIVRRLLSRKPVIYRCGAGKNKISICANGDIYPCDSFVGNEPFRLGNVFQDVDTYKMRQYYSYSIYNSKNCRNCWIRHLCGGDCHHNSYLTNHKIDQPDEIICKINQHIAMLAMEILLEVENNDHLRQYFDRVLNARQSTY
jgi:uncharacterized protein